MRFAFKENSLNKENGSPFSYFFSFDKTVTPISNLAHLFFAKNRQKTKELNFPPKQIGFASQVFAHLTPFSQSALPQAFGILIFIFLVSLKCFSQNIQQPQTPTFNNTNSLNINNGNTNPINNNPTQYNNTVFTPNYKAPLPNEKQNAQTKNAINQYSDIKSELNTKESKYKKQLWELQLKGFRFANPNSPEYKLNHQCYLAAYDSINDMLLGKKPYNLKRAIFLVENAYYGNKGKYKQFTDLIDNYVYILKQIIKNENLDINNNLSLNYAIQKLFLEKVKYKDKNGIVKFHDPFKYDFENPMGDKDYSKQFVFKSLIANTGQCHNLPLTYKLLATEIGAKANIAYSPNHSYITFPDNDNYYYNFECTSGAFTSYAFIMSSGYVSSNAINSGIYTVPVSDQQLLANQLNDLGIQHLMTFGTDDFQLQCAKRTLEVFPNNIMALQSISNHQTAKVQATGYYLGFPKPENIENYPDLKNEMDKRNNMYDYIDMLGYTQMSDEVYKKWLNSVNLEKAKKESEEIKKTILLKVKVLN
jgi:hypothetical protein